MNSLLAPFPLPVELVDLIETGVWPKLTVGSASEAWKRVNKERFRDLVPDEREICFYAPPFRTIQEEIELGSAYWRMPETAVAQIDPAKALVIGDFGSGSDTTLALDYRSGNSSPSVMRLQWMEVDPAFTNRWVTVSDSFGAFCRLLEII